jgi:hypothetical protein
MNLGSVVPEKDPYFLPPVRAFGNGEVKVRIDKLPGLDVDDHTSQNHCFCIRALLELDVKEEVP